MYYKPNINESIERFNKLWSREAVDKILVKIDIQDPGNSTMIKALKHVPDMKKIVDEWEKGFELNREIKDDNLPVVYGDFGAYIFGGFLGAEVKWLPGGAYAIPFIKDMKNYKKYLLFDENNKYFRMQIDYIKYLIERSKDKFIFCEMIAIDGLNFLDNVRGGDAYTDLYDYSKEVIDMLEFSSDLNIKIIKHQRKLIETYKGGRFQNFGIWTPGETVYISVDAYGQCGSEVFEKFGRKFIQKMIDEFNGGWLHVHSDAVRLLPSYISLKNLIGLGLEDWINPPRAIEHIDDILEITGEIPLMINISSDELIGMIESKKLPGNILYWVNGVRDTKKANEIAEIAYNYKARYKRRLF